MAVKNTFQTAGFGAQQRIRILLNQPDDNQNLLQLGDWHADNRFLYLGLMTWKPVGMFKAYLAMIGG